MASSQSFIHLKPANLIQSVKNINSNVNQNMLLKIQLAKFPSVIGHATSRINRLYNEDTYSIRMLKLPTVEQEFLLSKSLENHTHPSNITDYRSVLNLSVFDGHGSNRVSKLLADRLHDEVAKGFASLEDFEGLLKDYTRMIGGKYWEKLYENRSTFYERFIKNCNTKKEHVLYGSNPSGSRMIFDKYGNIIDKTSLLSEHERLRIYYSFLKFDLLTCCGFEDSPKMSFPERIESYTGGSTASSIFISSYTQEDNIFNESFFVDPNGLLKLVVTQVGDCKIILCDSNGIAHSITKIHSASSTRESKRLTDSEDISPIETDSFGDVRFLNNFANTRSFGDLTGKPDGLSSEPDIYSYLIGSTKTLPHSEKSKLQFGGDECCIVMVTDGVANLMADQEIVDLITSTVNLRGLKKSTPQFCAEEVIQYISAVAGKRADNATCLVLRLPNWGNWPDIDRSGAIREQKLMESSQTAPK